MYDNSFFSLSKKFLWGYLYGFSVCIFQISKWNLEMSGLEPPLFDLLLLAHLLNETIFSPSSLNFKPFGIRREILMTLQKWEDYT